MFSSDVPESPERIRRVRWHPWDVYMRSSRGKRPREQQWCRGNQEQLGRKSEALWRVAKPVWPPVWNDCCKPVPGSQLWSSITKPSVRFLHGIPYNHLTNIPDYNRPYVYLNDLYVRERMGCRRPNQTPSASPWSFVSGQVSGGNRPLLLLFFSSFAFYSFPMDFMRCLGDGIMRRTLSVRSVWCLCVM